MWAMDDRGRVVPGVFETSAEYRELIENLHAGLVVHAADTSILLCNGRSAELLGLTVDQMTGKTALDPAWCFVDADERPMPLEDYPVNRVLTTRRPLTNQVVGINRPATCDRVWALCNAYPVLSAEGALRQVVVTFIDISEQRHAEAEARRLEEQLRQAQRMEAVGQLAGGIAHDFNNLLTGILGYAELLQDDLPGESREREAALQIQRAAERAANLTRQLLAFSRKQVLQPRRLNLNEQVQDLQKLLGRVIGENIELVTHLAPELATVVADPGQIEQVIMNLAVDARDAMPGGGRLTVETANVALDEAYAASHADVLPGPHVMLSVSDNGHGMDDETRARLFEPFFTTKAKGRGTGLGLSTVYGIVKQSGGNIWVYSEPGAGATFKVYLPVVDGSVECPAEAAERRQMVGGAEKVLVVEDDAAVRYLTVRILRRHGYDVREAADADAALRACHEFDRPPDLLVTDIVMPRTSGRTLARQLAVLRPGLRVLYMSGYTDNAIVHQGVLDEGTAFLQKPFSAETLLCKVRAVLDGAPDKASA